ncbi:hypothetical protein [Gloeocapsopsis sp. IPPAS B-1203]|uniref:hypothetical protein n=1 Tax=Gloeocapsopsis sp. IPPAS B-1203 TaxID=2049454 RepID=UPI00117BEAC1|nr:hypothetical protein [Gloeocapsopsis sp. IPPAS B-1203]
MSCKYRLTFKNILATFLILSLTPVTMAVQAEEVSDRPESNVGQNIRCSEASQAEQYWTPERMERAEPPSMTRPGSPNPDAQPEPPSSPETSAPSWSPQEDVQPQTED